MMGSKIVARSWRSIVHISIGGAAGFGRTGLLCRFRSALAQGGEHGLRVRVDPSP